MSAAVDEAGGRRGRVSGAGLGVGAVPAQALASRFSAGRGGAARQSGAGPG